MTNRGGLYPDPNNPANTLSGDGRQQEAPRPHLVVEVRMWRERGKTTDMMLRRIGDLMANEMRDQKSPIREYSIKIVRAEYE